MKRSIRQWAYSQIKREPDPDEKPCLPTWLELIIDALIIAAIAYLLISELA